MFKTHAHRTMDMTEGSLLAKVLFFSLPIMLSGICSCSSTRRIPSWSAGLRAMKRWRPSGSVGFAQ